MTTLKPIDQLTPEELRVECAESLGIVECDEGAWTHIFHGNMGKLGKCSHADCRPPGRLPDYPADANAALTLAHALAEKGWSHSHVCYSGETDFEFFHFGTARPRFRATATGPHAFALALCCAYLAVVRDGKGQIL